MTPSTQKRIVQIELPLRDGKYSYFSGYILADGLIITCRHGFSNPDAYDDSKKVMIRSYDFSEEVELLGSNYKELCDSQNFFKFASDDVDVVLLLCSEAKAPFHDIQTSSLYGKGDWDAGGYPFFERASRDTKGYRNFDGDFTALELGANHLKLSVSKPKPENLSDWKSASGCPVFIGGQLAGILCQYSVYDDQEGQKRKVKDQLEASYLKALFLTSDEFKEIIISLSNKARCYHKDKFLGALDDSLKRFLAEYFDVEQVELHSALLDEPRDKWLEAFVQAKQELPTNPQIDNAFISLIALGYEGLGGPDSLLVSDQPYVNVPIVREEGCEFFMSAHDQRDPMFRITSSGVIPGKYCMTASPEGGIGSDPSDDVAEAFLSASANEDAVVRRIFGDYKTSRIQSSEKNDLIRQRKIVQVKLKREKHHYYWPLEITEGDKERIEKLHASFPSIKILNVSDDIDLDVEEEGLFSELAQFIKD